MKMTILVGRCLERDTMLIWVNEHIKKNFVTCKSLCNLQELCTASKEKYSNVNIGFSKFYALRPKWCVLVDWLKNGSLCVCSAHQNVMLLVDAVYWDLKYKNLIVCNPETNKYMMHWSESCPGTGIQKEFLNEELREREDDEEFNYCQ